MTSPVSFWLVSGFIAPCTFMLGGKSLEMNRSEPPAWLMAVSSFRMCDFACSSVNAGMDGPVDGKDRWILGRERAAR